MISYNLFAYCSNNPRMGYDPTGKWTFSIGWSFSAFLLGGSSYSVSIAFDSSGNIALQTTTADVFKKNSGGIFGLASIGVGKTYSYTNLETVDDLEGPAVSTGSSLISSGILSADYEKITTFEDNPQFVGASILGSLGVSLGKGAHKTISITETKTKINVFDIAKDIWSTVFGWFS